MTKNQYQMATGALSTKVAIASFLGGTLLLLMYFYFKVFRKKPFRLNTRLLCGLSKIVK